MQVKTQKQVMALQNKALPLFACKLNHHHTDRSYRKGKCTHGATMHTVDIKRFEIRLSV